MGFFTKQDRRGEFYRLFDEQFGDSFTLIPGQEIIRKGIYGKGKTHPKVSDFTGDYVACGISDKVLRFRALNEKPRPAPAAAFGGLTDEEMIVPLITVATRKTAEYHPPMLGDITPNIKFF